MILTANNLFAKLNNLNVCNVLVCITIIHKIYQEILTQNVFCALDVTLLTFIHTQVHLGDVT